MSVEGGVRAVLAAIDKKIAGVSAFRATVTAVDGSLIQIQREGAATAGTENYASCSRFLLTVGDVVLCIPLGGKPVIVDVIRRAASASEPFTKLADLSDVTAASPGAIAGKVLAWDGSLWDDKWCYTETMGVWSMNDVPGTATTAMSLLYFNTATALNQSTNRIRAGRAGYIVGARITSDAARTAGTCTVEIDVSGVSTAFDAGGCALDGTRTTQDASIVAPADGVRIASGADTIGVNVVTSGWTPTNADLNVTIMMMYDPF